MQIFVIDFNWYAQIFFYSINMHVIVSRVSKDVILTSEGLFRDFGHDLPWSNSIVYLITKKKDKESQIV